MSWRPWVAWIALFPALAMLLGSAFSIAHLASKFPWQDLGEFTPQRLWVVTLCAALCIVVWSWCIGFGLGWVAREAWISVMVALSASAVMLIETTVNAAIPARLLLALFAAVLVTAPAYAGLRRGLHNQPLDPMQALTVTATPIAALLVSVSQQPGSGWPIDIRELLFTLLFLWPVLIPSASRFAIRFRSR
jgi:hypothetical protein